MLRNNAPRLAAANGSNRKFSQKETSSTTALMVLGQLAISVEFSSSALFSLLTKNDGTHETRVHQNIYGCRTELQPLLCHQNAIIYTHDYCQGKANFCKFFYTSTEIKLLGTEYLRVELLQKTVMANMNPCTDSSTISLTYAFTSEGNELHREMQI